MRGALVVVASLLLAADPVAPPREAGVPIGNGTTIPRITITAPRGGWSVDRMLLVEGSVSDTTVDPITVSINGARYLMRTSGGTFSRKFPAASGKNVVTVMGTNHGGTGSAQVTTFAQVPAVPLKVVLTSDTDGVYTDLHLYEPTKESAKLGNVRLQPSNMAHVYWANTESPSGGTFYLNEQNGDFDQPGYGPYLYVHRAPPRGVYLIATNYWPSGDKAHTLATLNVSLFEGTPNEVRRTVRVPLATPGSTQALAWVNVLDAGKAIIYVPGQDPVPSGPEWPASLDTSGFESGGGGDEYGEGGGEDY